MTTPPRGAVRRSSGPRHSRVLAVAVSCLAAAALAAGASALSASPTGHNQKTLAAKASSRAARGFLAARYSDVRKKADSYVELTEDGSSLFYPLYNAWVAGYASTHPGFSSTSGADGSGTGIADAENGTTDFGASDAYLPTDTYSEYPTIENIPMAISAQMINYNLGSSFDKKYNLKLDGKVIAEIYQGQITNWDSSAIAKLNKGVKLPNLKIIPVHRSDSSGDSFLFTSYLAFSDPSSFAGKQGPSTLPTWPSVPGELAAKGNSGMVETCGATKGCIAYIGISYHEDTNSAHLGLSDLENKSGNFELPDATTIHNEVSSFTSVPANGSISLIYGPAKHGYPIINFEYIVLKTNQSSSQVASEMKAFLTWGISRTDGNSGTYLAPVEFQPLTLKAAEVAHNLIAKIH